MYKRLPDELQENILKRACTPFQLVYFDDDEHFDVCLSTYLELLQTSRAVRKAVRIRVLATYIDHPQHFAFALRAFSPMLESLVLKVDRSSSEILLCLEKAARSSLKEVHLDFVELDPEDPDDRTMCSKKKVSRHSWIQTDGRFSLASLQSAQT
jgi:hypothetical protein